MTKKLTRASAPLTASRQRVVEKDRDAEAQGEFTSLPVTREDLSTILAGMDALLSTNRDRIGWQFRTAPLTMRIQKLVQQMGGQVTTDNPPGS